MRVVHLNATDPTVKQLAGVVGYDGRLFKAIIGDRCPLSGTYWDGGSRSEYHAVRLNGMARVDLPHYAPPQFGGPTSTPVVEIPPGVVIVEHAIIAGKDRGLAFHVRTNDVAPMLPAHATLTHAQRIVLVATRSLKSSYGGVPDYRYHESRRQTGIAREQWDEAVAQLIELKLLAKNKSITPEGRNAVEDVGDLYRLKMGGEQRD